MIQRKVIEWVPNMWWVVDERPTGYTPLYKGEDRADAERWLSENPLQFCWDTTENPCDCGVQGCGKPNATENAAETISQTALANEIIDEIIAEEKWNTLDNGLTPD